MAYTEAQKRATLKYRRENLKSMSMYVPAETKARYKQAAAALGMSFAQLVTTAIDDYINKRLA